MGPKDEKKLDVLDIGIGIDEGSDDIEQEAELKAKSDTQADRKKLGYLALYRYATSFDIMLILLGSLGSVIVGVSQPVMSM
jgi:hypothetical protein